MSVLLTAEAELCTLVKQNAGNYVKVPDIAVL